MALPMAGAAFWTAEHMKWQAVRPQPQPSMPMRARTRRTMSHLGMPPEGGGEAGVGSGVVMVDPFYSEGGGEAPIDSPAEPGGDGGILLDEGDLSEEGERFFFAVDGVDHPNDGERYDAQEHGG